MDINCVHNCIHQTDGKCTLNRLPDNTHSTQAINMNTDVDCLYFKSSY